MSYLREFSIVKVGWDDIYIYMILYKGIKRNCICMKIERIKNKIFAKENLLKVKGVGEGEGGGACASPLSKVGGGHKWVCGPPPPTFGQIKCSNFAI